MPGGECGGTLNSLSGTLTYIDRDGDGYYDRDRSCFWTINALPENIIVVSVTEMELQPDSLCNKDYLEVRPMFSLVLLLLLLLLLIIIMIMIVIVITMTLISLRLESSLGVYM